MKKIITFLLLLHSPSFLYAKDLTFIVNEQVSKKNISKREIKNLFMKQKQYWPNGKKIRPVEQTLGSPARKFFLKTLLKKSEIEMSEYWIEQKQLNGLVQPIQLENDQLVIQLVKSMPGAIGYIWIDSTKNINKEGLRVLEGNYQ